MTSVDIDAADSLGPVPARPAMAGNGRTRRFAAPNGRWL